MGTDPGGVMSDKNESISPYLLRSRRTYAEALRDRAERRRQARRSPAREPTADDLAVTRRPDDRDDG